MLAGYSLAALIFCNYLSPYMVFGNLLLIETAALFLIAGIIDFGSSLAFFQLRKSISTKRDTYSANKRKDSERRALVLVCSGGTLFGILILLAILNS
jgi:uncharacterized membrane protein YedE/YeeE